MKNQQKEQLPVVFEALAEVFHVWLSIFNLQACSPAPMNEPLLQGYCAQLTSCCLK